MIKLDLSKSGIEISSQIKEQADAANLLLESKEGKGNDFLGWVNLPSSIDADQLSAINAAADKLRGKAEVIIAIGIGGSPVLRRY